MTMAPSDNPDAPDDQPERSGAEAGHLTLLGQ
jgi:hypothetical protein